MCVPFRVWLGSHLTSRGNPLHPGTFECLSKLSNPCFPTWTGVRSFSTLTIQNSISLLRKVWTWSLVLSNLPLETLFPSSVSIWFGVTPGATSHYWSRPSLAVRSSVSPSTQWSSCNWLMNTSSIWTVKRPRLGEHYYTHGQKSTGFIQDFSWEH